MDRHNGINTFNCTECSAKFSSKMSFTQHIRRHAEPKIEYKCDYCNRVFTKYQTYTEHVKNVHTNPKFECTLCEVKFSREDKLMAHMNKHNNVSNKPYNCFDCGKSFVSK